MDTLIERKKRFTPRRIYGGAGVLFILVFVFYFIFRDTGSSMTIDKSRITIATVTENEFNDYVRVIGQVLPSRMIYLDAIEGGRVEERLHEEGVMVKKGDVILRFKTDNSDLKIHYQTSRLNDCSAQLADLAYLAKGEKPTMFSSPVRQQEYAYFIRKKQELETALTQAEKEYMRNKTLFEKKVISEEEYDGYYFKLQSQRNELASLVQSQLSTWQADQNTYRNTYNEMNSNLKQEVKDKDMYIVRSPVDGTVDQFSGVYRGSNIQAGQALAVISPDSTLCLEVYVTPRNIGFMSVGMPVKVQVESFNYNEWGMVSGKVKEISSDFLTDSQGNSFYKVKCEMERDYLQLKNGRVGKLKKGMTVSAHFMVARRSLFDLLYQKMDSWVNPRQYESETMVAKLN